MSENYLRVRKGALVKPVSSCKYLIHYSEEVAPGTLCWSPVILPYDNEYLYMPEITVTYEALSWQPDKTFKKGTDPQGGPIFIKGDYTLIKGEQLTIKHKRKTIYYGPDNKMIVEICIPSSS